MTSGIIGLGRLKKKIKSFGNAASKEVLRAVVLSALDYQEKLKRGLNEGSRTGRIYQRGTRTHQASAAGEFPKTDTGQLVNSINLRVDKNDMSAEVFSALKDEEGDNIASKLEFGSRKIEPRPMWHPLLIGSRKDYTANINKAVQKVIKKHTK